MGIDVLLELFRFAFFIDDPAVAAAIDRKGFAREGRKFVLAADDVIFFF